MGMSSGDNNGMMSEINVTPFVDVMLVSNHLHGHRTNDESGYKYNYQRPPPISCQQMKRHSSEYFTRGTITWLKKIMNWAS